MLFYLGIDYYPVFFKLCHNDEWFNILVKFDDLLCFNTLWVLALILIISEFPIIDTTLATLTAKDDDGPKELQFSIPAGHPTEKIVRLDNVRGVSSSAEGRSVDIVLISQLDREYTVSLLAGYLME